MRCSCQMCQLSFRAAIAHSRGPSYVQRYRVFEYDYRFAYHLGCFVARRMISTNHRFVMFHSKRRHLSTRYAEDYCLTESWNSQAEKAFMREFESGIYQQHRKHYRDLENNFDKLRKLEFRFFSTASDVRDGYYKHFIVRLTENSGYGFSNDPAVAMLLELEQLDCGLIIARHEAMKNAAHA